MCSRCSRCRWCRPRSAARSRSQTLDGTERVGIDPGTESGTTVRLKGKGIPNLGRGGRGDLFLTIAVQTPRDLSKDQRRLVEELARLRGEVGREADDHGGDAATSRDAGSMSSSCPFCRVVAGEAPAEILHSTETVLAFRDLDRRRPRTCC